MASYRKITDIDAEKIHFNIENPMIANASAGLYQGIGLYVIVISGLGIFLTLLIALIFQTFYAGSKGSFLESSGTSRILTFSPVLIIISVLLTLIILSSRDTVINNNVIRANIEKNLTNMGKAIVDGDYNTFINYSHPVVIQNIGGKEKSIQLLKSSMLELKNSGFIIKKITLSDLNQVEVDGTQIQAIITQIVHFSSVGQVKTEIQKMIAISEDFGQIWYFININGKTKSEMKMIFPSLNPNLEF
jgi:hypothetical protein